MSPMRVASTIQRMEIESCSQLARADASRRRKPTSGPSNLAGLRGLLAATFRGGPSACRSWGRAGQACSAGVRLSDHQTLALSWLMVGIH
jgi:hypothetical protein